METRAGRGTSLLSDVKTRLNSSSCSAPYPPLTLGAPLSPRGRKKSREFASISENQAAKSGPRLHGKDVFTRQQDSHDNRAFADQLSFEDRARFETPPHPPSRMASPSALIRGHGKIGNERKPVSASACIQSGRLAIQSLLTCFGGEGANQRDQTVMYNVFSDTFAYLMGAVSCLGFSQLRKHPWGPQTAS